MQNSLTLQDHIDAPILRSVIYLNLLGVKTLFSCCGFDYKGERVPKNHIYGNPQIMFAVNTNSMKIMCDIIHYDVFAQNGSWQIQILPTHKHNPQLRGNLICHHIRYIHAENSKWNDKESPHFHEGGNLAIKVLEDRLLQFQDRFMEYAILEDGNKIFKWVYPHWQYPVVEDWKVFKKDWV